MGTKSAQLVSQTLWFPVKYVTSQILFKMYKQSFLLAVATFAALHMVQGSDKVVSFDVYHIENRAFTDGVLTVFLNDTKNVNDLPKPIVSVFNNTAGQKWRVESALMTESFQLRPTASENYVLEQNERDGFLKWVASLTTLRDERYWYLFDAGDDYKLIKNKQYDYCLTVQADKSVEAMPCVNKPEQQWKFIA